MIGREAPTGLVAVCRCGAPIEVLDLDRAFPGHLWFTVREWIRDGYVIEPRFWARWDMSIQACRCEPAGVIEEVQS